MGGAGCAVTASEARMRRFEVSRSCQSRDQVAFGFSGQGNGPRCDVAADRQLIDMPVHAFVMPQMAAETRAYSAGTARRPGINIPAFRQGLLAAAGPRKRNDLVNLEDEDVGPPERPERRRADRDRRCCRRRKRPSKCRSSFRGGRAVGTLIIVLFKVLSISINWLNSMMKCNHNSIFWLCYRPIDAISSQDSTQDPE